MADEPAVPRPRPCASCPYRRDAPSGLWHPDEYAKLPTFDGPTWGQNPRAFHCHQGTGHVCSGWLATHDGSQLLAVRIGLIEGRLDPACLEYSTDVPVWASGGEAAAHGLADVDRPGQAARAAGDKLRAARAARTRTAASGPVPTVQP